jgi:hypothetical protein
MRTRVGLIGLLIVVTAIGAAAWAAPPGTPTTAPPTGAVSDTGALPRGGVRQSVPSGPVISALSADECKNLGGAVYDDPIGVCASKKICATTDNYGKNHHVCLSATAGNVW